MYMYHTIAVVIGVKVAQQFHQSNWVSYPVAFILTILISALSYQYFEKPFLKMKTKFTMVKSG